MAKDGRETRLVQRILGGDKAAGERFITEHYPRVSRLLHHLTGSPQHAEDPTQQTFLKAWQALATFRGEASLATWSSARSPWSAAPGLPSTQLQAEAMAEGARVLFGLEEWDFARGANERPHLRYLASFTPDQRPAALSPAGLPFGRMTLAQQQEYIFFAFVRYGKNPQAPPDVRLEELANATLRVEYAPPVGFEWRIPAGPGRDLYELFLVRGQTREATLAAALQVDPQASPAQIVPAERALAVGYLRGNPETGLQGLAVRASDAGFGIRGPRFLPAREGRRGASPP